MLLALLFTAGCSVSAGGSRASAPAASTAPASPAASSQAAQTVSAASAPEPAAPFSEAELESIANGAALELTDGFCCSRLWVPKAPGATARQVAAWLRQARPYTGKIPASQEPNIIPKANITPTTLTVSASGGYRFSMQPASYWTRGKGGMYEHFVPDVLALRANGKTSFLRCAPLYGFLQNGGWEPGFRLKYGG